MSVFYLKYFLASSQSMVSMVIGCCSISRSVFRNVKRKNIPNVSFKTNGFFPQINNVPVPVTSKYDISMLQVCTDCLALQCRFFCGFSRKFNLVDQRNSISFNRVVNPGHYGLTSCQHRCASSDTSHYYTTTEFFPVKLAQDYTLAVHDFTGLPWWASIILCTIMLRTVITLPLFVVAQRNIARYANVNKEMVEVSKILKAEVFHFSRNKNLSLQETKNLYSQQV